MEKKRFWLGLAVGMALGVAGTLFVSCIDFAVVRARAEQRAAHMKPAAPAAAAAADAEPSSDRAEPSTPAPAVTNRQPVVDFAHGGRYLPPVGARAVAIRSVNVARVHAEIRRVPAANLVQMLALEEGAYRHIRRRWYESDAQKEEFVESLSTEPSTCEIVAANRLNEEETNRLAFVSRERAPALDGVAADGNGIYLLMVRRADVARRDSSSWWEDDEDRQLFNPARYRVVCVTDLGLSVRQTSEGLAVWVTSFTTGRPVAGAAIDVYSTANIRLGTAVTDENGWCRLAVAEGGEPFAVVATAADGGDMSFIALSGSTSVEESVEVRGRETYLAPADCTAFVWSERGIYRHGETIFLHAILRNGAGVAPPPFPVEVQLVSPKGNVLARETHVPDAFGALSTTSFAVPAEQMSGRWQLLVKVPGEKGVTLGSRVVKIEEFAPPQIRVKAAVVAAEGAAPRPQDFAFDVTAEHLFGGAAAGLRCEGAVVFEDVAFAPDGWRGYTFGDETRGLKPNFRRLAADRLDERGACRFAAPLQKETGLPRAAVRCTAQGTVFEDGGRPANARARVVAHYYPYYIGSPLTEWLRKPETGRPVVALACVAPDGRRLGETKRLTATVERIDTVYSCSRTREGWMTWTCDRVRVPVGGALAVTATPDGDVELELPIDACGDYALTVRDPETGVCFSKSFYLSDWGDAAVRAPLANPTVVTVAPDKPFYRVGDVPRLVVKSPFTGTALLTVCRDDLVHAQVFALDQATGEIDLPPVTHAWAPNVEVHLSVVQALAAGTDHLAVRAHGDATILVRPAERELAVQVAPELRDRTLTAAVTAPGARRAVVTVVDEGINLLTDERTPDPLAFFARPRRAADDTLYDLYSRLLPVLDDDTLRIGGVKTGGDVGAELLGRVSPVPTRRFTPLARWQADIELSDDGAGAATFALPEFAGELRVTAVAYSATATGSAATRQKVVPKLIIQPDAPRFVAPGDAFEASLPLVNRSGGAGEVVYSVAGTAGTVTLKDGETRVLRVRVTAPPQPGEMELAFTADGFGEHHDAVIPLPVRPAVAWREQAGVEVLAPGQARDFAAYASDGRFTYAVSSSRLGELRAALTWLADYPHGCLEQTSSRIFPLLTADGILAAQSPVADRVADYVAAGVRRVESMIRATDFVMWPDCNSAPWDREVSLYAAHFLVEAERSGARLKPASRQQVLKFLRAWALSPTNSISAYACHTLALARAADKDRMLHLYDRRADLGLLDRARLARAFVAVHDRPRATALLAGADAPSSVKEAAFLLLAQLELDRGDARIPALARYLEANRDPTRFSWGTTESNAHALLALGAYYATLPLVEGRPEIARDGATLTNVGDGTAFVSWRSLTLPDASTVTNEARELAIERTFLTADGAAADLGDLHRGDLLFVRLKLKSAVERDYADLVIEDLFAGAFEPVHDAPAAGLPDWVMRTDARDDRMLVFSKKFRLGRNEEVVYTYPVRVVSSGVYALPAVAVEAMYQPRLAARFGAGRVVVRD